MTDQTKRNEATYRALIDSVWSREAPDWAFLRQQLSPDYQRVDATLPRQGADAGVQVQKELRAAFKDARYEVLSVFGSGDQLCARWRLTGTFVGPLRGHAAPGGKPIAVEGISINHFDADGRMRQGWIAADYLQLFQQAGLTDLRALGG